MELIVRIAAVALTGCAAALLLKRGGAPLTLPLAAMVCAFILYLAVGALRPALELLERAKALSGLGGAYYLPVLKCVVIGLITRGASDLCRDSGQSAMAGAVEFGGVCCALFAALPLLETLLGLLERLM